MTSGWRSVLGLGVATVAIVLGLTACLDADMDILVNEDGSGSITASIRLDEYFLTVAGLDSYMDVESLCEEILNEAGEAGTETFDIGNETLERLDWNYDIRFEEGSGACTFTESISWDTAEAEAVLAEFADADGYVIGRLANGGWLFELDVSELYEEADALALPLLYRAPTLTFSVTLPGDVARHNADSVSPSKHTWEIEFSDGPTADSPRAQCLYLETEPINGNSGPGFEPSSRGCGLGVEPGSGSSGLGIGAIVAIIAGALLVLAAIVGLYWRQRAKASAAIQGSPLTHGTTANPATKSDEDSGATGDAATDGDEAREDATLHRADNQQTEQQ